MDNSGATDSFGLKQRNRQTLIIGLSGPSSSGKTTLARLLRQIFNTSSTLSPTPQSSELTEGARAGLAPSVKLFILHEDDFYKTDKFIPQNTFTSSTYGTRTLDDWDCVESIDLPLLHSTLTHIKQHGSLPPDLISKEDQNTVGVSGVSDSTVSELHDQITKWISSLHLPHTPQVQLDTNTNTPTETKTPTMNDNPQPSITICLLDGFLLYPSPHSAPGTQSRALLDTMNETLDARFFIPSTRAQTIERRTKRTGYVTLEGFWEDPEGYVEDVVWPNFGRDHAWLFGGLETHKPEDGSIAEGNEVERNIYVDDEGVRSAVDEGRVDRDVTGQWGITVGPGTGEAHLREILPWAVDRLKEAISAKLGSVP